MLEPEQAFDQINPLNFCQATAAALRAYAYDLGPDVFIKDGKTGSILHIGLQAADAGNYCLTYSEFSARLLLPLQQVCLVVIDLLLSSNRPVVHRGMLLWHSAQPTDNLYHRAEEPDCTCLAYPWAFGTILALSE